MKQSSPTISVIIPVYNAAQWLERCLDSVERQTLSSLEIILINDGSADASRAICEKHAAADARIAVVNQENQGPAAARNAGLDRVTGEYTMFIDADDFIEPRMAETLFAGVTGENAEWAICGCAQWVGRGDTAKKTLDIGLGKEGKLPAIESLMGFARGDVKIMTTFASLWNKIFLTRIIREYDIRFGATCPGTDIPVYPQEDFFFNLRYLEKIATAVFIDQPLYNYQVHQTNLNAVRKYRPHAFELHREVYGAVRRTIWPVCTPEEKRSFNRHHLDKTLIIIAILCRDNQVYGKKYLLEKIRAILADAAVRASLADYAPTGSQDNRLLEAIRRSDVESLYDWARNKGNEMYGPC